MRIVLPAGLEVAIHGRFSFQAVSFAIVVEPGIRRLKTLMSGNGNVLHAIIADLDQALKSVGL